MHSSAEESLRTVTDSSRSRVVSWADPRPGTEAGLAMAGVDYLRAIVAGELAAAPISRLMQFDLTEAEPGRVTFVCRPDESMYNPIGAVHGGLMCTLLDSAAGCALHSVLPPGKGYTSVEIKVSYLKAVRADTGDLVATGTVVKSGARVGFTEATITDRAGVLLATATSTLLVFDR
jgi:uncharacterized protein (TIGR00369 family)